MIESRIFRRDRLLGYPGGLDNPREPLYDLRRKEDKQGWSREPQRGERAGAKDAGSVSLQGLWKEPTLLMPRLEHLRN